MATKPAPIQSLGAQLLEARQGRWLTQQQVADELGVSVRRYQSWEWGEVTNPQGRVRERILNWLAEGS